MMLNLKVSKTVERIVDKVEQGERISVQDALHLWTEAPLSLLGMVATGIKESKSEKKVYYNRNFHLEPTNVCKFNCKFCSYRREAESPEAWEHTTEQLEQRVKEYEGSGVTEVHIVGGVHPKNDLYYYIKMIEMVKAILPEVVIKAFTAIELNYMIQKAGLSTLEGLKLLQKAGMEAIPGGGAEIFDREIRERVCPEKGDAEMWLGIHREAHKLGITTNATMLYGHIEGPKHRVDHLDRLRTLQDETMGFNAFIPLKYRSHGNSMSEIGEVGIVEDMRVMAISRIFLDNFPHIKAYWPMFGKTTTAIALAFGADDIDGTIDNSTKIYSMAGAEDKRPKMTIGEIERMVEQAGYRAVERDTLYNEVPKSREEGGENIALA